MSYFLPKPLVPGSRCVCYPGGDRETEPRHGIVTGPWPPHPDGILDISLVRKGALALEPVTAVRFIDDPYLKTHPDYCKGVNRFAWDYVETVEEEAKKILNRKLKERDARRREAKKTAEEALSAKA